MDMLTNAQETMHTSAESLQSFTRSERAASWVSFWVQQLVGGWIMDCGAVIFEPTLSHWSFSIIFYLPSFWNEINTCQTSLFKRLNLNHPLPFFFAVPLQEIMRDSAANMEMQLREVGGPSFTRAPGLGTMTWNHEIQMGGVQLKHPYQFDSSCCHFFSGNGS